MNPKQIIFLDIDGTLLDASYASNDETLPDFIKTLESSGNYIFGLNSNRSIEDMLPIAEKFSIEGPVIGENGAFAYYTGTQQTTYFLPASQLNGLSQQKQRLEEAIELALLEYFANKTVIWIDADTVGVISKGAAPEQSSNGDIVVLNNKFRKYTTSAHVYRNIDGRLVQLTSDEIESVLDCMKSHFSEDSFSVVYDGNFSNILGYSSLTSKRKAIEKLINQYPDYALSSIGDDLQDYEMTKDIGTFLTIANASEAVRNKAAVVAAKPYTQGVRELLETIESTKTSNGAQSEEIKIGNITFSSSTAMKGGETASELYRAVSTDGTTYILKYGGVNGDDSEIESNQAGYAGIAKVCPSIVPTPLLFETTDTRRVLIMPDLQTSMNDMDSTLSTQDYQDFLETLTAQVSTSFERNSKQAMQTGLESVLDAIRKWSASVQAEDTLLLVDQIDVEKLCGNTSSLMLLDFTADNVFFINGQVAVIDPWKQSTYRGSFVVSLAQYATLAVDIKQLESASRAKMDGAFDTSFQNLKNALGLSNKQLRGQYLLGAALQFCLSGYARANRDHESSRHCLQKLHECISECVKITKEEIKE